MTRYFFQYVILLLFGLNLTTQLVAQELDFTPIEKMVTPSADFVGCMNVNALKEPKIHQFLPICSEIVQRLEQRGTTHSKEVLPLFYVVGNVKNKTVYFLMKSQMTEDEAFTFLTHLTDVVSLKSKWGKKSNMAVCLNPYNGEKIYFFQIEKGIYFLGNQTSVLAIQKQLKLKTKSPLIPNMPNVAKKSHIFLAYSPSKDLTGPSTFKLKQMSVFNQEANGKEYLYAIAQTQPFKNPAMMRVFYISIINGYLLQETKSQKTTAQLMKCIALNVKAEQTSLRLELNSFSLLEISKILFKNRKVMGIK